MSLRIRVRRATCRRFVEKVLSGPPSLLSMKTLKRLNNTHNANEPRVHTCNGEKKSIHVLAEPCQSMHMYCRPVLPSSEGKNQIVTL